MCVLKKRELAQPPHGLRYEQRIHRITSRKEQLSANDLGPRSHVHSPGDVRQPAKAGVRGLDENGIDAMPGKRREGDLGPHGGALRLFLAVRNGWCECGNQG